MNRERIAAVIARFRRPAAVFAAVSVIACAHEGSFPRAAYETLASFCQVVVMAQPVVNRLGTAGAEALDAGARDASVDR